MPIANSEEVLNVVKGNDASTGSRYENLRQKIGGYIHVTFDELGLASREETEKLRRWWDQLDVSKDEDLDKADQMYKEFFEKQLQSAIQLHREYIDVLYEARRDNIIPEQSFTEWIKWIRDPNRDYKDKESSIRNDLPKYLKERRELAKSREELLKDTHLEKVQNPRLKKEIEFMKDDKEWFGTLTFTQRKNLIERIKAGLAAEKGGAVYEKLFSKAEKILKDATALPQPALHRDKVGVWLKRIFESGATPEQIEAFLTGSGKVEGHSLPQLIAIWRRVAVQFWKTRADSAFKGVKSEFTDTKGFLWMHYEERVQYVQMMKKQRDRANVLRAQAQSRIDVPNVNQWIDQHLFNGSHTLEDLESIINGDLAQHLAPLQDYMKGKDAQEEEENQKTAGTEAQQIDELLSTMHPGLQGMCIELCSMGSKAIGALGWASFNRGWCNRRGYLNTEREYAAIKQGKEQARQKTRQKQRRGVVSETIQGETGEEEYIELSRSAPTNICLDLSDAGARSALVSTIRRRKNDDRAWYWTNLICHQGGALMNLADQDVETKKMYKMRQLLRTMEAKGQYYSFRRSAAALVQKPSRRELPKSKSVQ